jgi:hypothetical protein
VVRREAQSPDRGDRCGACGTICAPALSHDSDGGGHDAFAHNADEVDGRDAVGAGASRGTRAGKLVATNGKGRFPTNIVDGFVLGSRPQQS